MNVVKEIQRINEQELASGSKGSWHDQYKDSAHVFIGGLHNGLTEGDVISIFSQYGEVVDINMPRDKETGKTRGFAFLMYEDQRSTILAVDNLNGAKVLDRTLRVDHTFYEQRGKKNADGEWEEPEAPSYNAAPQLTRAEAGSGDSDVDSILSELDIDPEDPMRDWLISKFKDEKGKSKSKKSKRHEGETPEERRARKERKKAKREAKAKKQEEERERSVPSKRRRGNSMSISPPPDRLSKRDEDPDRRGADRHDGKRGESYHRRRDDDERRRDRDYDQRTSRDVGRDRDQGRP
ncbi:hypothetical protein M407DRAFT_33791 [Tulasnella calospora MUT 4182]|uniref:RRM domain-containing protein n=1 Tax=Tulasnella calospora MUT 4182 TaxID=1051891 RepID=A0A0C3Q1Q7_9AGAM|nr:hypothetical protein M407DRAFT_33791 [Tulasnella calospora MUT 4182]